MHTVALYKPHMKNVYQVRSPVLFIFGVLETASIHATKCILCVATGARVLLGRRCMNQRHPGLSGHILFKHSFHFRETVVLKCLIYPLLFVIALEILAGKI